MGEIPGCIHERVMVGGHGIETEDMGVTTLLTVEAMKFRTLVVWMSKSSLSTGEATIMETIGAEVFGGSTYVASSQNDWTQVAGSCGNSDGRGYNLWRMGTIIHACG